LVSLYLHLKASHICLAVHPLHFWSVDLKASFPIFRFGNMRAMLNIPFFFRWALQLKPPDNNQLYAGYLWDHFTNSMAMHLDFCLRATDYSMLCPRLIP
jgi:hypothetical protein